MLHRAVTRSICADSFCFFLSFGLRHFDATSRFIRPFLCPRTRLARRAFPQESCTTSAQLFICAFPQGRKAFPLESFVNELSMFSCPSTKMARRAFPQVPWSMSAGFLVCLFCCPPTKLARSRAKMVRPPGFWVGRPFLSRRFLRPRRRAQPFSLKALGQQALHRPPLHPEKMARGSCFPAQALNNERSVVFLCVSAKRSQLMFFGQQGSFVRFCALAHDWRAELSHRSLARRALNCSSVRSRRGAKLSR